MKLCVLVPKLHQHIICMSNGPFVKVPLSRSLALPHEAQHHALHMPAGPTPCQPDPCPDGLPGLALAWLGQAQLDGARAKVG